jgi:hypothetical protein
MWMRRRRKKTIGVGEGRMHPGCVEYAIYELAHG